MDAAVAAAAPEVAEEEAVAIARGHAVAHVVDEARWTVGHVVDRHERREWALLVERHPHAFAVPCAAVVEPLEPDAPAAVGAIDNLHEPRAIAAVAVVVAGQQVAEVVEREFLRVAQAAVHDFEVAAVEFAAQHGAFVREVEQLAFLGAHREAAVADRDVEPAVGAHEQAVQVVADQRRVDAKAVEHRFARLRRAVAVCVDDAPELGDVGKPHVLADAQHTRRDAVCEFGKAVCEHDALVEDEIIVVVDEQLDAFAVARVLGDVVRDVLLVLANTLFDGAQREVVVLPLHVFARVEHAVVDAEGFADQRAALLVDRECDDVAEVGFRRDEARLQKRRELQRGERLLRLVAARCDVHRLLRVLALLRRGGRVLREQRAGADAWPCGKETNARCGMRHGTRMVGGHQPRSSAHPVPRPRRSAARGHSRRQDLLPVRPRDRVAQEVGALLGRGSVVQRRVQEGPPRCARPHDRAAVAGVACGSRHVGLDLPVRGRARAGGRLGAVDGAGAHGCETPRRTRRGGDHAEGFCRRSVDGEGADPRPPSALTPFGGRPPP